MKQIITIALIAFSQLVMAKSVVTEIKVEGQCGDCKERIEKALDVQGISFATWDVETKMLTIRYNDKKYSEDEIHKMISELGYSTDKLAANTDSQSKLPGCCQPKEPVKAGCEKKGCCKKKQ